MLRKFLLISYIIALDLAFTSPLFAQDTLDELNAALKAKKAELEPFDEKKVKVDVESLGLDDVEKKAEEKTPAVKAEEKLAEKKPEEIKPPEKAPEAEVKIVVPPETVVVPLPVEPQKAEEKIQKAEKKTPTQKYINSEKKRNLKKRLEAEKQKRDHEKERQNKAHKLKELREKYLIKLDETSTEEHKEDWEESGKIIPYPKEVNPFISDETPALPILNRYRTRENLHIPIISTPLEKIDILFDTITRGNVSFFNSAYKNVGNPNVKNQLGDTIVTYSILMKRLAITASALAKGANPNLPNNLGYTPIDITIELLDFKSLELLVDNEANINYRDAFGRTYLMHAARVGFLPAVELLVAKGVDINAMDDDGFTALSIAYRHKKEVIVKYLLSHGAKTWVEKPFTPEDQSLIKELENRWK